MEKLYFKEIKDKIKKLSPLEESNMFFQAQSGDTKSFDQLFANYAFFAVFEARKRQMKQYDDELASAACEGLIEAIKLFNPSLGNKFTTFAVWHIKKHINLWLNKNYRTIRLPSNIINEIHTGQKEAQDFTFCQSASAFDPEVIDNIHSYVDEQYELVDRLTKVKQMISFLPEHQQKIIIARITDENSNWSQIGEKYGYTGENARFHFNKGINRIKKKYSKEEIINFFFNKCGF